MGVTDNFGPLRRNWKSSTDDTTMRCYLGMQHRVSIQDIADYFAEHHPHVDLSQVELNYATAAWDEPATEDDRADRQAWRADRAARKDAWERETYDRLKERFGE